MFGDMLDSIMDAFPIPEPSAVPTAAPTETDVPTSSTTVSVSVSMTMEGLDASSITDDDLDAIAVGLASVLDGVDSDDIYNIKVTDASRRRRSLLGSSATVTFDVMVDLSSDDVTFSSADELAESVSSDMDDVASDSTSLISAIKSEIAASATDDGATSKWDDVTGVSDVETTVNTRSPTMAPTCDGKCDDGDDSDDGIGLGLGSAGADIGVICAIVAVGGAAAVVAFFQISKAKAGHKKHKPAIVGEDKDTSIDMDNAVEMKSNPAAAPVTVEVPAEDIFAVPDIGAMGRRMSASIGQMMQQTSTESNDDV